MAAAAATMTPCLAITNAGKVGIGTIAPTEALDVVGNIKASGTITGTFAANSVNAAAIIDGSVTATKLANGAVTSAKINVDGNFSLNNNDLKLLYGDAFHGLGWYGVDKLFGDANVDGPVLYGFHGGALGTNNDGGQKVALSWDSNDNVTVPTKLSAGPGLTGTPLAYGNFGSDGSKNSGSSNISCSWISGSNWYQCTILNETINNTNNYVVNVTPRHYSTVAIPSFDSVNGQLIVALHNVNGSLIQADVGFALVIYKP